MATDTLPMQRTHHFADRRQEDRRILLAADRGDEMGAEIEAATKAALARYRSIREDESRTDAWKRQELARVYVAHREELDRKFHDRAAEIEAKDARDAAAVLGVVGLAGDPAGLAISRRDAADRVRALDNADDRRETMRQALRIGDEVLARAVLDQAITDRNRETVDVFTHARPRHADVIERLWARRDPDVAAHVAASTAALAMLIPSELQGMSQPAIRALAEGTTS